MTQPQHTPGELSIDPASDTTIALHVHDGDLHVATLEPRDDPDREACREADARRLALCWNTHADLVATLAKCVPVLKRLDPLGHLSGEFALLAEVRAVLAKAALAKATIGDSQ